MEASDLRKELETELVDAVDIARFVGVKISTVNSWVASRPESGFPDPVYERSGAKRSANRIWLRREVMQWVSERRRPRGRPRLRSLD